MLRYPKFERRLGEVSAFGFIINSRSIGYQLFVRLSEGIYEAQNGNVSCAFCMERAG